MNSNFSMKEDFDVSFTPSIKKQLQSLEIKGVCEVKHFREGDLLSIDVGENVITNAGKVQLVKMMSGIDTDAFIHMGLGRRGDIGATITDTTLGGSVGATTGYNETQGASGYAVDTDGSSHGIEYQANIVLPRVGASGSVSAVSPRSATGADGASSALSQTDTHRFYVELDSTGVSFPSDTCLWSANYLFDSIETGYPGGSGAETIIVNEAGIFNSHISSGTTPVMLARRTFSDKPVKNADELTIKWKITIK